MEKKFKEKSFYIYKFLNDCLPIYQLYAILFRENGLSLTEISFTFSFWSLVVLIAEVPSGILADRWNRKHMLCIATILKLLCYVVWFFSSTVVMFAAGFLFWGIAEAFKSGTEEGLLYDNLKTDNREKEFTGIYGKGRFYASIGTVIGIISGGVLASFISIRIISMISAVLLMINFFFVCQLREKNYYSARLEKENIDYFKTLSDAVKLCLKNSKILIGMILLVSIISVISYSDEYDALIIDDFSLVYIWVSVIYTVRFVFIAIGSHFAAIIEKKMKSKNKVFILTAAASLFLLTFSMIWNQYAIPILGICCIMMTVAEVIQTNIIQNEIYEEGRTTVMSLLGVSQNVAMIVYSLIFALLCNAYTLQASYVIISVYCVIGIILLYFIWSTKRE